MTRIYVGYPTALEFWDATEQIGGPHGAACETGDLDDAAGTLEVARQSFLALEPWASCVRRPLSLLVGRPVGRSHARGLACRVRSGALPPGSFRTVDDVTALATPAMCFLLAARQLRPVDLLQLGLEICGSYSSGPDGLDERRRGRPLTSAAAIGAFLQRAGSSHGIRRARAVSPHLVDLMRSPMESVTYLLLCLPRSLGGLGLPRPVANTRVAVPPELRALSGGAPYVLPDLCWPKAKVCLEYDSDEHHAGGTRAARDSARRDALAGMGYRVHTVNKTLADDSVLFEALARLMAEELGMPAATLTAHDAHERAERRELRRLLLDRGRPWKRGETLTSGRTGAAAADARRKTMRVLRPPNE